MPTSGRVTITVESSTNTRAKPDIKSNPNPNPNPNPTPIQHAIVNIQLNIVTCPTYRGKFIRDNVVALFVPTSIVIVTLPRHSASQAVYHTLRNARVTDWLTDLEAGRADVSGRRRRRRGRRHVGSRRRWRHRWRHHDAAAAMTTTTSWCLATTTNNNDKTLKWRWQRVFRRSRTRVSYNYTDRRSDAQRYHRSHLTQHAASRVAIDTVRSSSSSSSRRYIARVYRRTSCSTVRQSPPYDVMRRLFLSACFKRRFCQHA